MYNNFKGDLQGQKKWSTDITSGCYQLLCSTIGCKRIVYVEQDPNEPHDPVKQVLDYSGVDALAIHDFKKMSMLSFRTSNSTQPQVTMRQTERIQWTQKHDYVQPDFHVQLARPKGQEHIYNVVILDLNRFREAVDPDHYFNELHYKNGQGSFFKMTDEGLKLPCVRIYNF